MTMAAEIKKVQGNEPGPSSGGNIGVKITHSQPLKEKQGGGCAC